MKRIASIVLLLSVSVGCGADRTDTAAGPGPSHGERAARVTVVEVPDVMLRAGETTTMAVEVVVADGFHVQANPAAAEFLIPLELSIEPGAGVEVDAPVYPPARRHRLQGAEDDLLTYEGAIAIEVSMTAPPGAPGGRTVLAGSLRYQACDSRRCFAPTTIPFEVPVVVGS